MRLALARALFRKPDLLLLDEPTNHLDLFAAVWLENFLKRWKKTLLVVSHDVQLLDEICTDIIHIYCQKLDTYRGNYSSFKSGYAERRRAHIKAYDKQQKELANLKKMKGDTSQQSAKKSKGGNQARKQFKQKERQMNKKDIIRRPEKEYFVNFDFPPADRLDPPMLQVKDVSFKYNPSGDKTAEDMPYIIRDLDCAIDQDTRVVLVGRNGVGKSTIIKLLCLEEKATDGEVIVNHKLRIGRFNQHFSDKLPLDKTPVEYLKSLHSDLTDQDCRQRLGRYGLPGPQHVNPISTLSGGQKARVMFAVLSYENAHILVLDEPTNHLDIESVDALITAVKAFEGGVVLVTHNQRLIRDACTDIWIVEDQRVNHFEGDFDAYANGLYAEVDFELEGLFE